MEGISEKQFEQQVHDLARLYHWLYYHTWRSYHSPAGFPDCVLVRGNRLIFAELKAEAGKVSDKQQEWLDALGECGHKYSDTQTGGYPLRTIPEVYLWRPSQIDEIVKTLL